MKAWTEITHYAGFDWARDHHMVVIVDSQGQIVADFEFEHSLEGWKTFGEKTAAWPNLAVAIETTQGAAIDQLLQRDMTVYPVAPVASKSYRTRKAPSGSRPITATAGDWPTHCAWTATAGRHSIRWIH